MKIFGLIFLILFLISCDHLPHNKSPLHCHLKRAAIDMGSGSTKILVAKVDKCQRRILNIIEEKNFPFKFKESLHLHGNRIDPKLEEKVIEKLKGFLDRLKSADIAISGVATEVFRQALNGKDFIRVLSHQLKIPLKVIDQEKEAHLGFWGAVGVTQKDPQKILVWDIGGGSMQITTLQGKKPQTYLGKLASVSFKNTIVNHQGQRRGSPNPIGLHTATWAENYATKYAQKDISQHFKTLVNKKEVLGIGGVHYYSIRMQVGEVKNSVFSQYDLDNAISERRDWADHKFVSNYKETEVSNLILVKSFMKALNIQSVKPIKVNLATGLLFDEDLW